jgi:hypothetical protein
LEKLAGENAKKEVPASCTDSLDEKKMDPRVKAMLKTINVRYDATQQGNTITYRNTIGNNLCYIGQATEETLELHTHIPGRTPMTVQDQKNPFMMPTPLPLSNTGSSFAETETSPGVLPSYRPQLIAEEFDTLLCQQQGLPSRTPPVLCTLQYVRRLQLPIQIPGLQGTSLVKQEAQQQAPLEHYKDIAPGLGSRIATSLYEKYAPRIMGSLTDLLAEAAKQLDSLSKVQFPERMCPTGLNPPQ